MHDTITVIRRALWPAFIGERDMHTRATLHEGEACSCKMVLRVETTSNPDPDDTCTQCVRWRDTKLSHFVFIDRKRVSGLEKARNSCVTRDVSDIESQPVKRDLNKNVGRFD